MASGDAKPIPLKGVAYRVTFPIFDADGDLVTGPTGLDSEVSKDAGTFADCTNEATEIATSSGMYYLDLTATEMDADTVAVIVKTSTSGAKTTPIVLYPEEAGDIRVNVTQISGDGTAADNLEAATDGGTYNVGGGAIVAASVTGAVGSVTGAVGSVTGNVGGNVTGSIGSLAAQAKADVNAEVAGSLNTAIPGSPVADSINERVATMDGRILGTIAAGTHNPQGGDAYARLGAPAGASVSADVAAVKGDTAGVKTKTDYLPSATAGAAGGVFIAGANAATTVNITGNLSGSVGSVTGAVGSVTGNVGGNVTGSVGSVTAGVTVSDKTGFKLAADGLDSVSTTGPSGVAGNFREMLVQLWRRQFKKATMTATQLKTYADDGTTATTTQTLSDDSTTQTQGAAT